MDLAERAAECLADTDCTCSPAKGIIRDAMAELTALRSDLADAKNISCATVGHQGSIMEGYRVRAETAERDLAALRSQISTAYTAGVEAMREAAKAVAFQAVDGLVDMADGSGTQTVYSALCTLPVPEREGK